MAGGADTNQWMGPPPKLDVLIPKTRGDAITEDLSARHAKNIHRDMKKDRRSIPLLEKKLDTAVKVAMRRRIMRIAITIIAWYLPTRKSWQHYNGDLEVLNRASCRKSSQR
jgi:hypothetical protein